jgi:phosphopantetheinyl transferase
MNIFEQQAISRSNDKARTFARLWSMKESFLKYVGTGIDENISNINFSGYHGDSFEYRSGKMQIINGEKTVVSLFGSETLPVKYLTKIDLFDFLIGEPQNGKFAFA